MNRLVKLAVLIYIFFFIAWILRNFFLEISGFFYWPFTFYMLLALYGGIVSLSVAKGWGGAKSYVGKSILFLALGLLAQVFGQLYYFISIDFLHIEVPYPSLGDVGYFISIPLYALGVWYLAKASGSKFSLQNNKNKALVVLIPLAILSISYYIFLREYDFTDVPPLNVFLDFGYPLGQAFYISLAILAYILSKNTLGGEMKSKVLLVLFALCIQYVSDYTFLYQASQGTWVAGGINDLFYLTAYLVMTIALLNFKTVLNRLKQ